MARLKTSEERRKRRHLRVRRKVHGTVTRPRACVYRSLRYTYVQLVDDDASRTLLALSTLARTVRERLNGPAGNVEAARILGKCLAEMAVEKGIQEAVFDRSGYRYHGRIRAVAEGIRKGGVRL